jgi:hypothetical protein
MAPKHVCWRSGNWWVGHLADYPDYSTQGESHEDLIAHLADHQQDFSKGLVPGVRRVSEADAPTQRKLCSR